MLKAMVAADPPPRVRSLTPAEIKAYDLIPESIARRARVITIPKPPGPFQGFAVGRNVWLTKPVEADGNSALLAHELVHLRQWNELGVVGFSVRYLQDFFKGVRTHRNWMKAYSNINAEAEARQLTRDWLTRRRAHTDQIPEE